MKISPLCKVITYLVFFHLIFFQILKADENNRFLRDKIELGRSYYKSGNYAEAYDYLKKLFKENPENLSINFLLGRTEFELGKYEESIFTFQRMLIAHPDLLRVKLEIARSYMTLGVNEKAVSIFNEVLSQKPPEDVVNNINSLLKIIYARSKKHFFNSSVSIARGFDDNVNTSPTDQIIEIPAFGNIPMTVAPEESDAFTSYNLNFKYTYLRESQLFSRFDTNFSYYRNDYDGVDSQTLDFFDLKISPFLNINTTSLIKPEISFQHIRVDNLDYLNIAGASIGYFKDISKNYFYSIGFDFNKKDYDEYDSKDSYEYSSNISLSGVYKKFFFSPFMEISKENADSETDSNLKYSAGLGLNIKPMNNLSFSTSVKYQNSEYEKKDPFFMKKRKDESIFVTADLNYRIYKSKKPGISYFLGVSHLYIKNDSNIDLNEYTKNKTSIYIKTAF